MSWYARWVRLWNRREHAESLALVRIMLPLVVLWDLFEVWRLGLIRPLWAPIEEGGFGPASYREPVIEFYRTYGASMHSTQWLYGLTIVAALMLALGLFTRSSALALLLLYAQLEALSPDADRGIDTLLRNVLCILVFSRAGATFSVDARMRQSVPSGARAERGSFRSDVLVPAWPRYLIIAQLVLLYFFAGVAKDAANWSWNGGYVALFYVLHEPHHARFALSHEWLITAFPLTQLGTLATVSWERCAPLLPLLLWLRASQTRGSALHRWVNRLRLLEVWVGTGVFFHLSLALMLALGIFPWGCLALYPAIAAPDSWRRWLRLRAPWPAKAATT